MKKTAVLIYDQFCNFEIAPALEMLVMARKPITIFAKSLTPVRRALAFGEMLEIKVSPKTFGLLLWEE